jgi:mannose-6-phosphate isomerase-like protein (cupin superfamily)
MEHGTIIMEHEGVPVLPKAFGRGFMLRVVHPQNPKCPSKNIAASVAYLHPKGVIERHRHPAEEIYIVLEGEGIGYFGLGKPVPIRKETYIHIPSDCEHGVENTGGGILRILCVMTPPNPPMAEWKSECQEG